jgi:hypothetical protein
MQYNKTTTKIIFIIESFVVWTLLVGEDEYNVLSGFLFCGCLHKIYSEQRKSISDYDQLVIICCLGLCFKNC